jgi:WD40 repeat protein
LLGDFKRPVNTDRWKDVANPILREDLEHCFAGDPQDRFSGAGQLAKNLHSLSTRQTAYEARRRSEQVAQRRRVTVLMFAGIASILLLIAIALGYGLRRADKEAWLARRNLYVADMNLAFRALEENNLGNAKEFLVKYQHDPKAKELRGWEWRHLWARCRSDELALIGKFPWGVVGVAFSEDGRHLAAADLHGLLQVFETSSGRSIATNQTDGVSWLQSQLFSTNGRWLAFPSSGDHVRFWDLTTLREGAAALTVTNGALAFALSGNGEQLATISHDMLQLWDVKTSRQLLWHKFDNAGSVAFSPDGVTLAICTPDGRILLFDNLSQSERPIGTDENRAMLKPGNSENCRVRFSPDGKLLASCAEGVLPLQVWDIPSGKLRFSVTNESARVDGLAFSPDEKVLATTGTDQLLKLWDTATGQRICAFRGHQGEVWTVAFSPDGKTLATGSKEGTVRLWSAAAKPDPYVSRANSRAFDSRRSFLASSFDGSFILTVNATPVSTNNGNSTYSLWDVVSLREIDTHPCPVTNPSAVAIAVGGRLAAIGGDDGQIQLFDPADSAPQGHPVGLKTAVVNVAFSSDSKFLAAGGEDGSFTVWDIQSKKSMLQHDTQEGTCWSLAFSSDTRLLGVSNMSGHAEVWDLANWTEIAVLAGHLDSTSLAFSRDSQTVFTASRDATIKRWDARTGQLQASFGEQALAYFSLVVSPDGRRIVTRSIGDQLKLWDAATGQELARLALGKDLEPLGFSADGNALLLARPGELSVWRAPSLAEIDIAAPSSGRMK